MSEISLFDFQGYQIRHVGTADEPEWVGADVVNILYPAAIKNKNQFTYLSKVPLEWKGSRKIATPGGTQDMTTVYEPGLYALIGRSNSPLAVSFQKWVYEEVLPSIRKTGAYGVIEKPSILDINRANKRIELLHGKVAARRHYWEVMSRYYPGLAGEEPVDKPEPQLLQFPKQSSSIDPSVISFVQTRLKLLPVHPEVSEPEVTSAQMIEWYQDYCREQHIRSIGRSQFIYQLKGLAPKHFRLRRRLRVSETDERESNGKPIKKPAHWVCVELVG